MNKFKTLLLYLLFATVFTLVGWFANTLYNLPKSSNPISQIKSTPLAKYTIENLSKTSFEASEIKTGRILKDNDKFTSFLYTMKFSPDLSGNIKTVSGLINIPKDGGTHPVIVMFRGYVDPKNYFIGNGTQHAAEYFANNGYVTIAPDFLGYGESDKEAENIFESRFQTHVTAVETLKSVSSVKQWDGKNIFIWGHSNGGQITLTTLEILGINYPTVLWAPVSKPFPYSILYYTDDASDSGKFLRHELSIFENDYNAEQYSLSNYLDKIKAPIQLNQGTSDEAVPYAWSDLLNKNLKEKGVDITYIKYPQADHNMTPGWSSAIENSINFFNKHLR